MRALQRLLGRVGRAGIGCVLGVTEETVLAWLRRAASQAEAINRHLRRNLPVPQVQLDEMWNFIEHKRARDGRGRCKLARGRGRTARGRGQLCFRVSMDDRGRCGAAHPRNG
jgi:hypothetical protein